MIVVLLIIVICEKLKKNLIKYLVIIRNKMYKVYKLFIEERVLYVGSTKQKLAVRLTKHKNAMNNSLNQRYFYDDLLNIWLG